MIVDSHRQFDAHYLYMMTLIHRIRYTYRYHVTCLSNSKIRKLHWHHEPRSCKNLLSLHLLCSHCMLKVSFRGNCITTRTTTNICHSINTIPPTIINHATHAQNQQDTRTYTIHTLGTPCNSTLYINTITYFYVISYITYIPLTLFVSLSLWTLPYSPHMSSSLPLPPTLYNFFNTSLNPLLTIPSLLITLIYTRISSICLQIILKCPTTCPWHRRTPHCITSYHHQFNMYSCFDDSASILNYITTLSVQKINISNIFLPHHCHHRLKHHAPFLHNYYISHAILTHSVCIHIISKYVHPYFHRKSSIPLHFTHPPLTLPNHHHRYHQYTYHNTNPASILYLWPSIPYIYVYTIDAIPDCLHIYVLHFISTILYPPPPLTPSSSTLLNSQICSVPYNTTHILLPITGISSIPSMRLRNQVSLLYVAYTLLDTNPPPRPKLTLRTTRLLTYHLVHKCSTHTANQPTKLHMLHRHTSKHIPLQSYDL